MQQWEREYHTARIISPWTTIEVGNIPLKLIHPTREIRYEAMRIYRDSRNEAEYQGIYTEEEIQSLLIIKGIWSIKDSEELKKLYKAVDDLKVGLLENRLQRDHIKQIKLALIATRKEINRLEDIQHCYDYLTSEGIALSNKFRFTMGSCLINGNGVSIYNTDLDYLIDIIINGNRIERLDESGLREIARTEPWRSIWSSKNTCGKGLIDCPAIDLSDEQRNLILWSSIYDNIHESQDCPSEDVFEDDDMLDGWMIVQRRKRESQQMLNSIDSTANNKIKNSDEVFVMVNNLEDARKVDMINDRSAAITKQQRAKLIKEKGVVNEMEMPDVAQRFQMEIVKMQTKGR